ncbi:MAG: Predicted L-lactate dehydrogenase, Fe-S oxidoreductase subunit YkgE, partial [uncultured Frankineae bacterium]
AHRVVRDLPGRHAVPLGRPGDGHRPGAAGARGRVPVGPDLLRADAHQHRLPARRPAGRAAPRRGLRAVRRRRRAVGLVRRVGPSPARPGGAARRGRRAGAAGGGRRRADVRAVRAAGGRARGRGRRRVLPAPGDLPPDLPLAADASGRRQAAAPAARGAGTRAGRAAGGGVLLRLRRDLRAQERRHVDRHAGRQDAARRRHRCGGVHRRRLVLPDAHRRWAVAAAQRRAHAAPGGDPRRDRRPGRDGRRGQRARGGGPV